jgi:hypothetical protein
MGKGVSGRLSEVLWSLAEGLASDMVLGNVL